jgi:D-apionolactonase
VSPSEAWGPVPSGERWHSGRWSLDRRCDELADIRCDGEIVLRGVRAVARDQDWRTAAPQEVTADASSTADGPDGPDGDLTIRLRIAERGIALTGTVRVEGAGDRLAVTFEATADRDSLTNRTGLVVLHPPRLAGSELAVGRTDGTEAPMRFPVAISPHQPARDIASLSWADHGTAFHLGFEGDVFEMEDQRNWSDASFKTYSRSLDEPFPYVVLAGERIRQRVVLTAGARPPQDASLDEPAPEPTASIAPDMTPLELTAAGPFPLIAIGASTAPSPGPAVPDPVAAHRHVELDLGDPVWPAALDRAQLGAEDLSVMLVSPEPADPTLLADAVGALIAGVPLRWVGITSAVSHVSEPGLVAALRAALPAEVPVAGGARSHFTELNREWDRVARSALDGLFVATTPLFHTGETEQLVEAVAMQRLIAQDLAGRAAGMPVHIGPVTLRPRFNNVATSTPPAAQRTDLSEGYGAQRTGSDDPRQASPELAAWVVSSAAALAVPGVASLTCFEEWGPRGLRTSDGADLPVREALAALAALQGGELLTAESADGLVRAIGSRRGEHGEVLLANLSAQPRTVGVQGVAAATRSVEVGPFGWSRLEVRAPGRD